MIPFTMADGEWIIGGYRGRHISAGVKLIQRWRKFRAHPPRRSRLRRFFSMATSDVSWGFGLSLRRILARGSRAKLRGIDYRAIAQPPTWEKEAFGRGPVFFRTAGLATPGSIPPALSNQRSDSHSGKPSTLAKRRHSGHPDYRLRCRAYSPLRRVPKGR